MTLHHRREMPHPVLKPRNSDYVAEVSFSARIRDDLAYRNESTGQTHLLVRYDLNDQDLRKAIDQGQASYVCLTNSDRGQIREQHQSASEEATVTLETIRYAGNVTVHPFVVASRPIANFRSDGWNAWTKKALPNGTDLPQGALLAMGSHSDFNLEEAPSLDSCVQIVTSDTPQKSQYLIDLEGEHITIQVRQEDRPPIDRMRGGEESSNPLWPSLYLTAVEQAIRKHTMPEHTGKKWSRSVAEALAKHGMDAVEEETLANNSLVYAQTLMENPLEKLMGNRTAQ